MNRIIFGLATVALVGVAGCAKRSDVVQVSGKVTYAGAPLPAGVIYFNPSVDNSGPQGYAVIKDGNYTTADAKGRPVGGGAYEVRIQGFDGHAQNELPLGKPLFPSHEQAVDLPKANSTQDFDVPATRSELQ